VKRTGLALTQSLALTLLFQTSFKTTTGRTWPGIVDGWDSPLSKRSDRTDNYSGEFNWFKLDATGGWPSGHTANAFAAAATIAQIYHDNTLLKVGVYAYASLIGLSMSVYDHWASDIIAGALIGLAVGTTVGKSYRKLIDNKENKINLYVTDNSIGAVTMKTKNFIFLCIIAAAIAMYGCKTNTASVVENNTIENITVADDGKSFPVRFRGVWKKDNFASTLTFTENTLKAGNQSYTWYFDSVSGDVYSIKPDNTKYTGKITIKYVNGNLEISGDSAPNQENNWNGVWKKVK
jgi:hypothetical protein